MELRKLFYDNRYSFDRSGNSYFEGRLYNEDKIILVIDEKEYICKTEWLRLLAHYRVNIPFRYVYDNIYFTPTNSRVAKVYCGMTMWFKNPIVYKDDFYYIPSYTNFVINKSGVVKSVKTGRLLSAKINPYGYPAFQLYDNDKDYWRPICTHILLAKTFINNDDPIEKVLVNHIDGVKTNNDLSNLEWCTSRENIIHSFKEGLRPDNKKCLVRDIYTGEVKEFYSLGEATIFMGYNGRCCRNIDYFVDGNTIPMLFKSRYEIKLEDDNREWYYTNDVTTMVKMTGPYEALDLKTGKVYSSDTKNGLSRLINVSINVLSNNLNYPDNYSTRGFLIRQKSDKEWPTDVIIRKEITRRYFRVENLYNKKILFFDSRMKLCKTLGKDKRTLKNRLKTNKPYNDWLIIETTNDIK